jgi:hypothetical protein
MWFSELPNIFLLMFFRFKMTVIHIDGSHNEMKTNTCESLYEMDKAFPEHLKTNEEN